MLSELILVFAYHRDSIILSSKESRSPQRGEMSHESAENQLEEWKAKILPI